jgi:hypothetical protein
MNFLSGSIGCASVPVARIETDAIPLDGYPLCSSLNDGREIFSASDPSMCRWRTERRAGRSSRRRPCSSSRWAPTRSRGSSTAHNASRPACRRSAPARFRARCVSRKAGLAWPHPSTISSRASRYTNRSASFRFASAATMRANQLRFMVCRDGLRPGLRVAPHRPQAHPVRPGHLRHHSSQAVQDRRAGVGNVKNNDPSLIEPVTAS